MKAAFVTAVAAVSDETAIQQAFTQFVKKFQKQYPTEEVFTRYNAFKQNLAVIEAHDPSVGWTMGVNEFTDLTPEEFKATYLGYRHRDNEYFRSLNLHEIPENQVLADSIDWSQKGAVTPVKDQGQCGSCWAFSTTGGVEGAVFVKKGSLTSLSEQQLVDCAGSSGNQGCNGGLMDNAFQWIIKNGGIGSEASYQYTARDGTCKKVTSVSSISGFKDIQRGSESALQSAVSQQPVSIAIEADQTGFQHYKSGVFTGPCGKNLDHGVLLVGYGTDPTGGDYWKVKNSWGASWGDSGYIRLKRGSDLCGLADAASYPVA
jgi:C1A family cysteine protease